MIFFSKNKYILVTVNRTTIIVFLSFLIQSSHFVPTYTTLKWGLCLPSSCNPSTISKAFNVYFNQTLPTYVTVQTSIQDRYCKQGAVKDVRPGLLEGKTHNGWPLATYLGM